MSLRSVSVSSLVAIVIGAALTVAAWTMISRPLTVPPWPDIIQGLAFSPYQAGQDGVAGIMPTAAEVNADLALLSGKAHAVRTYATEGVFSEIPRLAAAHGLNVTVGAWLDTRQDNNIAEIERAIDLSREILDWLGTHPLPGKDAEHVLVAGVDHRRWRPRLLSRFGRL